MLNDTVDTPVGNLVVTAMNDSSTYTTPIYVSRMGYQKTTENYVSNFSVTLSDEKSTVINLSFKDVCIQRAEDILNTVIAVYNENWIKDKNQIAVSTSAFISDRLGVIEQELGNVDENISSYKSEHLLPDVQAAITRESSGRFSLRASHKAPHQNSSETTAQTRLSQVPPVQYFPSYA